MQTITITSENQGDRLDKYLTESLADLSRTKIQKIIKDGLVLINNKPTSVHQFLKEDDVITILDVNPNLPTAKPTTQNTKIQKHKNIGEVKVIAEEDDFLIIEKPAGMLVHPTDKEEKDTLVDWLLIHYPKLRNIGENPQRPAIVHRLDKDVSGLMIIPKTQESFDYFKSQFKLHNITKKYTALVYGEIARDEDEISLWIGRSKTKPGLFAARPESQGEENSKKALTKFLVLKRFINYTLLELDILTGRTHQIRVHMLAYGHPLIGDKLYMIKNFIKIIPTERIFLHATNLSFVDKSGQKWEFTSKLPRELEAILPQLKPKPVLNDK